MYKYRILKDQGEYKAGQELTQEEFKTLVNTYGMFQHIERIYISQDTGWKGNMEDCFLNFKNMEDTIKEKSERIKQLEETLTTIEKAIGVTKETNAKTEEFIEQEQTVPVSVDVVQMNASEKVEEVLDELNSEEHEEFTLI